MGKAGSDGGQECAERAQATGRSAGLVVVVHHSLRLHAAGSEVRLPARRRVACASRETAQVRTATATTSPHPPSPRFIHGNAPVQTTVVVGGSNVIRLWMSTVDQIISEIHRKMLLPTAGHSNNLGPAYRLQVYGTSYRVRRATRRKIKKQNQIQNQQKLRMQN